MKTTHLIAALIFPLSLVFLWAVPILLSEEFNAVSLSVEFLLLTATYLMLVYPGLFSFLARGNKQIRSRAMA